MRGVPSSCSEREVACLQRWAQGKRAVEAGALLGYSTIKLATVAAHVISIDLHDGYSGPTLSRYLSNLDRYNVSHRVTPLIGDAIALLREVRDVQFGFIDLNGKYETTRLALQSCRAPVFGLHDVTRPNCELNWVLETLPVRPLEHVDTLVVCEWR